MRLEAFISAKAEELGFCACGIAKAGPCLSFDRFREWLKLGCHAGMNYFAKNAELRADPRLLLPGAHSVICAAAAFKAGPAFAAYAGYACAQDYHAVLRLKMEQLAAEIAKKLGHEFGRRVCVDSAPILEREWALRAGIGRLGRQGCILNRRFGCSLFLAELLTTLELEPSAADSADGDLCGACRRCVEACPTGALRPDGFLDARKCLSYLTIEHKGDWPQMAWPAEAKEIIFGCDACVAACPYNAAAEERVLPEFRALPAAPYPEAEQCLRMNESEFQAVFGAAPVARLGLAGLKRNAARVLAARRK